MNVLRAQLVYAVQANHIPYAAYSPPLVIRIDGVGQPFEESFHEANRDFRNGDPAKVVRKKFHGKRARKRYGGTP